MSKEELIEYAIRTSEAIKEEEKQKLIDYVSNLEKENKKYKNQQKEFIEYLEKKEKEFDILGDPKNAGACKGILRKYKEIIGGKE